MSNPAVFPYEQHSYHLRFDKGFENVREETSRFRHFYFDRAVHIGYWKPLQLFNDLKVHQNITIQRP